MHLEEPRFALDAQFECELCEDVEFVAVYRPDNDGVDRYRGMKRCECSTRKLRTRALKRIPPAYRDLDLATLQPRSDLHAKQSELIEAVCHYPQQSYLLCGKNRTGKSAIGWVLYRAAIEAERPAIALPTAELLMQFRRWELNQDPPAVDAESLRDGRRWLLFLDEFDKARPTEFAAEQLFLLLDAACSYHHQVVITSNLAPDALKEHWSRSQITYGPSIMRRLFDLEDSCLVQMF